MLLLATLVYRHFGLSWFWFGVLFLAPDLTMLGYLAGPRVGAWCYNLAHCYASPVLVLGSAWLVTPGGAPQPQLLGAGLIGCAHIGFDRALGYGLKSPAGFHLTHLGPIGRKR